MNMPPIPEEQARMNQAKAEVYRELNHDCFGRGAENIPGCTCKVVLNDLITKRYWLLPKFD